MQAVIFVEDWQIECCQPPPGVGDLFVWRVQWVPAVEGAGVVDQVWRADSDTKAEGHEVTGGRPTGRIIRSGPLIAWWCTDGSGEASAIPTRGSLIADAHGSVPESVAPVRGRVLLVEVVDQAYRRTGRRTYEPISGDYSLRSVQRSPRWFQHGWVPNAGDSGEGPVQDRQESGVLVRLEVNLE